MKKVFSILMVVAMVFAIFALPAHAETLTYNDSKIITIGKASTIDIEAFTVSIDVDESKILCFDGGSIDYTYTIKSVRVLDPENATYVKFDEDPEAFGAVFGTETFKEKGADLYIDYSLEFASSDVFGELRYDVVITGFSSPLDTGLDLGGLLGDSSAGIPVAQDVTVAGSFPEFPAVDFSEVTRIQSPAKTTYYDSERFDPTGTKFEVTLTNGSTGTLSYTEETASFFTFSPSANENLTCYDTEVTTLLLGHPVNYTPIVVNHQWSEGPVNITTGKYAENKPGYHAIVCEGCGETHDAQAHTPKNEEWTYNNDETFVANGTESNVCADCGTVLVRDTFGTAGFNTTFADMHFIKVIFEYINILLRFIGAATY